MGDLVTLQGIMPPPAAPDLTVDWRLISESWGRQFPPDYQQFMGLYGAGTIEDFLVLAQPEPREAPAGPRNEEMAHETANAVLSWANVRKEPALQGLAPELIAWAADASADILCWDATDDDPSRWPVLVCNRGNMIWRRYECGMVEFLLRVLRREFDECPLGDESIWGRGRVTFLTPKEQERRLKAGLDPWTGEPDPYAGMYPA